MKPKSQRSRSDFGQSHRRIGVGVSMDGKVTRNELYHTDIDIRLSGDYFSKKRRLQGVDLAPGSRVAFFRIAYSRGSDSF